MKKFIHKQFDIATFKLSFVLTIIFFILFNSYIFYLRFLNKEILSSAMLLSKELSLSFLCIIILFIGLSIHRVLFFVGALILFLSSSASFYLFFTATIKVDLLELVFRISDENFAIVKDIKFIAWVAFCTAICLYAFKFYEPKNTKSTFWNVLLSLSCLFVSVINIFSPIYCELESYYPLALIYF